MVAARNGADPASNARLRLVVEQVRKVSMPKDTLDRPTALARAGIFPSTRGLLACHPVLIAAVLHRDFARNKDDATVVVIQGH